MELVYLSLIGIIGLQAYYIYGKRKWKKRYKEQLPVFQLIECSKDVIYQFEIKPKMKFKYISPSLDNFLGRGTIAESLINPNVPFKIIHPDDYETLCKKVNGQMDYSQTIIQRWKDDNGIYRWFEEYTTPIFENDELIGVQGIMRNIDEKVKLQKELQYRINHDVMTGIYNRDYFEKKFEELNGKVNIPVAIILCDLDELKYVNDNFGHKEGDILIKTTSDILKEFSSESVITSRLGGDEFAILVVESNRKIVEELVHNINFKVNSYYIESLCRTIKMSIGFAFSDVSINEMDKLFIEADKNMYKNKKEKRILITQENLGI